MEQTRPALLTPSFILIFFFLLLDKQILIGTGYRENVSVPTIHAAARPRHFPPGIHSGHDSPHLLLPRLHPLSVFTKSPLPSLP
jgi:hypothetical protein